MEEFSQELSKSHVNPSNESSVDLRASKQNYFKNTNPRGDIYQKEVKRSKNASEERDNISLYGEKSK